MKKLVLLLLCVLLGAASAWAGVIGTTDPNLFDDSVLWCTNYACTNPATQYGSPQTWFSGNANTGMVGLVSSENMEVLQQGLTWGGNFDPGMGIIYNSVLTLGNNPGGILISLGAPQFGVGAYIQDNWLTYSYTATISLYDAGFNLLGTYSASGDPFQAIFIGAYDSIADVSYALFDVSDGVNAEDFAIGTLKLQTGTPQVPEPGTLMLLGPSALGLFGVLRRLSRKEVQ
jgi:hypothetical protein